MDTSLHYAGESNTKRINLSTPIYTRTVTTTTHPGMQLSAITERINFDSELPPLDIKPVKGDVIILLKFEVVTAAANFAVAYDGAVKLLGGIICEDSLTTKVVFKVQVFANIQFHKVLAVERSSNVDKVVECEHFWRFLMRVAVTVWLLIVWLQDERGNFDERCAPYIFQG